MSGNMMVLGTSLRVKISKDLTRLLFNNFQLNCKQKLPRKSLIGRKITTLPVQIHPISFSAMIIDVSGGLQLTVVNGI